MDGSLVRLRLAQRALRVFPDATAEGRLERAANAALGKIKPWLSNASTIPGDAQDVLNLLRALDVEIRAVDGANFDIERAQEI